MRSKAITKPLVAVADSKEEGGWGGRPLLAHIKKNAFSV